jgi:trigger factor
LTAEIIEVTSCKRSLTAEIPAEEVEKEISGLARDYARNVKIPGFRPGKVPVSIVRQRFGADITGEATQKLIERYWKDAVESRDLKPLTQPEIQNMTHNPGENLTFTLEFEVLPEFEVKDYVGLEAKLDPSEVSDETVGRTIDMYRERQAQFIPLEGAEASEGHFLTVTVDGQFEGEAKPTRENDIILELGNPQTNPDFDNNLRGAKPGETRSFEVSYPEDYHRPRFAGKKVHYTVQVKDIKEKQLPELNDELAKDLGSESVEALRARVREDLVTQARQAAEKKAKEELLDILLERQKLEVPECLVQEELSSQAHRMASSLAYQGIDLNRTPIDWKKMFEAERPKAEKTVGRSMLLDAIARQENFPVTDEEIGAELEKLAAGTNKTPAAWRAQLEQEHRMEGLEQHLRRNKALDFIYRNAKLNLG